MIYIYTYGHTYIIYMNIYVYIYMLCIGCVCICPFFLNGYIYIYTYIHIYMLFRSRCTITGKNNIALINCHCVQNFSINLREHILILTRLAVASSAQPFERIWCCFELFSVMRLLPERWGTQHRISRFPTI